MSTFNISTGYFVIILLFINVILCDEVQNDYQRREYSLSRPYYDGRWDFIGSTIVTNNYIRLTSDSQSKHGGLWNSIPCKIHNWELHIHFKIHGGGSDLFGDGMALWYTKDRMIEGPAFGNKDYFSGLAIFLDTYSNHNGPHNHQHPYISATVNNGSIHYDHDRDGTITEIAGCESNFRGKQHDSYIAIRYENNVLTVSTDVDGDNSWKECFSVKGIQLPTGYYFGATASTGELADNHDIISLKMYDLTKDEVSAEEMAAYAEIIPSSLEHAPEREHHDDPSVVTKTVAIKRIGFFVLACVILIICSIGGYIFYTNRQNNQRKRFY